jgi:hypothetical protein
MRASVKSHLHELLLYQMGVPWAHASNRMHEQPDGFIDEALLSEQKPSSAWQLPVMQEGKKSNIEIAGRLDKTVVNMSAGDAIRRARPVNRPSAVSKNTASSRNFS